MGTSIAKVSTKQVLSVKYQQPTCLAIHKQADPQQLLAKKAYSPINLSSNFDSSSGFWSYPGGTQGLLHFYAVLAKKTSSQLSQFLSDYLARAHSFFVYVNYKRPRTYNARTQVHLTFQRIYTSALLQLCLVSIQLWTHIESFVAD